MEAGSQSPLIALVGPTGSGKSRLALKLAEHLPLEIINCDSMQVYRGLDIGTAKPSRREREVVPHHLFDVVEPTESYSAGRYMAEAREVCRAIISRGRIPLVVGGTGLYLRALLEGLFEGPGRSPEIRRRLRAIIEGGGLARLYRWLSRVDPDAAGRIHPNDAVRIVRALEVYLASGRPISGLQPNRRPLRGFQIVKVGLSPDRTELYDRINRRVVDMFRLGLVEEVEGLLRRGVPPRARGFEALGYRHVVAMLEGRLSRDEAVMLTQRDTRRYAKRQITWFRKESDVHWLPYTGEDPRALESLLRLLEREGVRAGIGDARS